MIEEAGHVIKNVNEAGQDQSHTKGLGHHEKSLKIVKFIKHSLAVESV